MPQTDFMPKSDGDRLTWFNNFSAKLNTHGATVGMTPPEIVAAQADCAGAIYMINQVVTAQQNTEQRVQYKKTLIDGRVGAPASAYPGNFVVQTVPAVVVAPGVIARLRVLVKRMKASAGYTAAIGDDLEIVAQTPVVNPNAKPTLTGLALIGMRVQIKFVKAGFDAVKVESKRGNESSYTYLGTFVRSPFVDTRAPLVASQSEQRT